MATGEFEGLRAVITGGGSGIGRATADLLSERGALVAVLDLRIEEVEPPLLAFRADMGARESVSSAVASAADALGGIDILVNNVGIGAIGTVADNDDAEWAHVLDINVTSIARASTAALPWLRQSSAASVVNTCSIAARNGLPHRALYSASKGAVLALTLAMAVDHLREGIRVNCVAPGTASTQWIDRLLEHAEDPAAERAALEARQPIGRLVTPREVANAIAYLASPLSGSTTGTVLDVDGGVTTLRVRPCDT